MTCSYTTSGNVATVPRPLGPDAPQPISHLQWAGSEYIGWMSGRLGNHLKMAKTDQERMGLFSEMGYTTIGDPYKSGNVESKRFPCVTCGDFSRRAGTSA